MAPKQRLLFSKRKESSRPVVKETTSPAAKETTRPPATTTTKKESKDVAAAPKKTTTTATETLVAGKTTATTTETVVSGNTTASPKATTESLAVTTEVGDETKTEEADSGESKKEAGDEERRASVPSLSGATMDPQRPVSAAVDYGLDDDDDDDDASMADEASSNVWNAYQRWRVTKTRLSGIPPHQQNDSSIMSNISTSLSSMLGTIPDEDDDEPSTLTRPEVTHQRMPSS